jgi:hypothetical protein
MKKKLAYEYFVQQSRLIWAKLELRLNELLCDDELEEVSSMAVRDLYSATDMLHKELDDLLTGIIRSARDDERMKELDQLFRKL